MIFIKTYKIEEFVGMVTAHISKKTLLYLNESPHSLINIHLLAQRMFYCIETYLINTSIQCALLYIYIH